ncbi:MAG: FtsX-like permease family protein [Erysipelotrichia bacterium]|nr:FtsX-like permease family protein [Erysipelotrichia bacterium]
MRLTEQIITGGTGLLDHPFRTFLTMLGIIFGVGAVIAMVSIGAGAEKEALEELKKFGDSSIRISSVEIQGERLSEALKKQARGLRMADVNSILSTCPFIDMAVPEKIDEYSFYSFNNKPLAKIIGVGEGFLPASRFEIDRGRFFSAFEQETAAQVAVLGAGIAAEVFGEVEAVGQVIQIERIRLKIIGVMKQQGSGSGKLAIKRRDHDRDVYIPIKTSLQRLEKWPVEDKDLYHEINSIWVEIKEGYDLLAARDRIAAILKRRHAEIDDFEIQVPLEILQQSQKTQNLFNLVMALIAGISLLVGGIGIMNIMLASVNERTREIGVRRALGASKRDIVIQFLVEATLISILGGLIGIFAGIGTSWLIALYTGWTTAVPLSSVLIAFFVSISVGIVFGSFPAAKASALDPVKALRYE